jgi:LmbE family N-acetylglucosaminyl deacetylase
VRRGDRVVCIHMTRGESGLYFRHRCSPEALGSIRQRELEASLSRLGVEEQRFLGYSDGRLAFAPSDDVVARVHEVLVEVQPDVIVTFGSDGFTGHPDHKSLSAGVTAAVRLWNKPRARVLHAAVPSQWRNTVVPRLNEFDFFWPGYPTNSVRPDVTVHLHDELLDAKVEALRAHASQMEPLFDAYGEEFMRSVAATEHFRLGPRAAFRSRMLLDLRSG